MSDPNLVHTTTARDAAPPEPKRAAAAAPKRTLDELVGSLKGRMIRVEGHTDTCGDENNNMSLSQQRSEAVALALVEMGVPREMMETVGYGSTQPRANEACESRQARSATELSRQTNRRVEFSILVCREGTAGGM